MQALIKEIHTFFRAFHPFCKRILKWGSPLVLYDKMLRLSSEFLLCGKEMFGAVVVSSLLLQLLCMAYAYDHGQSPL